MESLLNTTLVKSSYLQYVQHEESLIVWHSLFGNPKIIGIETWEFINSFVEPATVLDVFDAEDATEQQGVIQELVEAHFLIKPGMDERKLLRERTKLLVASSNNGELVGYLSFIMSEERNFLCEYCIHFTNTSGSKRSLSANKFMGPEIIRESIDWYFSLLREHGKVSGEINFGGGEPLLRLEGIKYAVEYCERNRGDLEIRYSLNTNGSLIDRETAEFLRRHHILVAISIDGPKRANDLVRLTRSKKPTYDLILRGLSCLEEIGYPVDGVAATVNANNFHLINEDFLDWGKSRGMRVVRIDVDVIGMIDIPVQQIAEKLLQLYRRSLRIGIDIAGFWRRPLQNLNESAFASHVGFCGGIKGKSLCVSPSGEIYYCGYSSGAIGELAHKESFFSNDGAYRALIESRAIGEMQMCKNCCIEGQCGGGCQITQEYASAAGSSKVQRMCDLYILMTRLLLLDQLQG